jgi:hypothetical protein
MKQHRTADRESGPDSASAQHEVGPTLPAWKAFVVQFSRETGAGTGVFSGRVEHLSSGRRGRFSSTEELVAILTELLAEVGKEPSHR